MEWDVISSGCLHWIDIKDANGRVIGHDQIATLSCIPAVFQLVVRGALEFAGITALVMIIISGIRLINSGGNPEQVASARKTLTFALIGLVLILLSFTIVEVIAYTTGAHCITTFGFESCK